MESLSRPAHRRKHSSKNTFSFKNPYDDVFLSNVGEREALGAHEYAEIFSGSSSIPILDLSGLDERVGPADCPSSKLDYNNIFGGFENDDVALSYEELLNGSDKETKLRITATHGEDSGSVHASRKPKDSFEDASDKSADGVNKQFNMSFNKTSQRNNDQSNGKMHIAQIHAVNEFIHFVENNPRMQKTNDGKTVNSLKREVSRTWSFSAEVEGSNGKSGLNSKNSHETEKLRNVDGVNLKPKFSKVPPFSMQSRASDFGSKKDVPEKIAGNSWPPHFGDEFGENSVAAESAAALKRAMDEAQESIRIAKMIMDRKREGLPNGAKPRAKARPNVSEKEDKVENDSYGSRKNSTKKKKEKLNDKFSQSFCHDDTFVSAPPVEVKRVWENTEAAKEHRRAFSEGGKLFSLTVSQRESPYMDEKIELEKAGKTVEAAEACNERSEFSVLVVKDCKSANLLPSTSKLASSNGYFETVEDNLEEEEVTFLCAEEPERALGTSQQNVEEVEQWRPSLDHVKEPKVGRVLNTSERTQEMDNVLGDDGKSLKITQENEVYEERESDMDCKGKEKLEEMHTVEHFTFLRSELDDFLEDSSNLAMNETLAQIETERESETVSENKENGHIEETYDEGSYPWFESEERLKEVKEEENNRRDPQPVIFQQKTVVEKTFNETLELENDHPKQNLALDRNEPELPENFEPINNEERHVNTSDGDKVPETITTGAENCAEIPKIALLFDSDETRNKIEEKPNNLQCEVDTFEEHMAEAVDLDSGSASPILSEAQTHDSSTKISEKNREMCSDFYLGNNSDESHRVIQSFKENNSPSEVIESFSGIHKDTMTESLVHLEDDNDFSRTETLRRVASEEVLLANKLPNIFDNRSFEGRMENADVMDADPREKLPEVVDVSYETSEIHDFVQESNIVGQPEFRSSNIHTSEFDLTDVGQVSEQTSGSERISVSTSPDENTDRASAQESEELAEGTNDKTPDSELPKDEFEPNSNERNHAEEQSEGLHCWSHIEPKDIEKSIDETNNENLLGTESTEAKDTKEMEKPVESENNNENIIKASITEAKETKANLQNSEKDDYQQRIEAIKRGREREKDRLAVERAIREARERAFAEARERAERASVERAAAESRQRSMAGARDKVEKSSRVKQTVDKSSNEAKIRAERAAVEKATAEARERALEKAMSQKATYAEGRTAERVTVSARNSGLKHSFSSSDLENGTESAQRRKARLERHQRIMERAAKALAEKNRRDLLVQKEQAERNRLAESLDAEIKRWVTGKEGNLRALLSTLQYILGPDSGWQPIPLTEIVTNAAVKKAYRKATLYVHPDKLQQRGASIHQKYLCEKVFDLLKAAWNRFNSDER